MQRSHESEPSEDTQMPELIDAGGEPVDENSLRARLSQDMQARIDAMIASMHRESELAAYDADAVRELGRHVI